MVIDDLFDKLSKEKIKRERAKTAKRFCAGMGIVAAIGAGIATAVLFAGKSGKEIQISMKNSAESIAETIKDTVQKKAGSVKNGVNYATDEVHRVIKDVDGKIEAVKTEMKDGGHEIKQDMHETAKNISKELNGAVK